MYTLPSDTITSPNWPFKYDDNMDCTYIIDVPNGVNIRISFEIFELETAVSRDGDVLYYGPGKIADISTAEGALSGYIKPDPIYMETGAMWLRFKSDERLTLNGFKLNYVATTSKFKTLCFLSGICCL